jgi:ribosomal protein L11 methylase PrmA
VATALKNSGFEIVETAHKEEWVAITSRIKVKG